MSKHPLPDLLHQNVQQDWQAFVQALSSRELTFEPKAEFKEVLFKVWAMSRYLAESCINQPEVFLGLVKSGDLNRDYQPQIYRSRLEQRLHPIKHEEDLMQMLREFRQREMFRIAWRDLAGWASLQETLRDLSLLADACVDLSLNKLYQWLTRQWGTPKDAEGQPQQLVVLGMGKLGAYELNFSSDIDLIFAYPVDCKTRQRKGLSCESFFTQLGQSLIRVIDTNTDHGFVFRVDMRLRPYGDSGALVASFEAMEDYYQYQGREWERYAMIKARVIAGDFVAGAKLLAQLRPFTYRRYLDYGAFSSLREMKAMIARQVQQKGMTDNIKLGHGGIREIEFIGQAFQLIRGGREPELQVRGIIPVLKLLAANHYLPEYVVDQLIEAYQFLRRSENHLQAYGDQQVHELPKADDEKLSLALSMGFQDWESYHAILSKHRSFVQGAFEQIMDAPQVNESDQDDSDLQGIWEKSVDDEAALSLLAQAGYKDARYALGLLHGLHSSSAYNSRSEIGKTRMDRLMPLLIGAIGRSENPDQCLLRVINLLESISGRSTYLALLAENPMALSHLVQLFSQSAWIAEHLVHHPVVLDEFLDPRSLYAPLTKKNMQEELALRLSQLQANDLEQQMESLRNFKQSNVLHVAAADLVNAMSLIEVSNHLTDIAEVILEQILTISLSTMTQKFGEPLCNSKRSSRNPGFAVIGYGKVGGFELGYGSDLDLVFLHDSQGANQQTTGPKQIDNAVFFARVGQRFIHFLNTHTASGILYEVDMRLRPSGASGLLVTSLESFEQYQREEAWTWEHQALVRARAIVGDAKLIDEFNRVRQQVLCLERDADKLRGDVVEMRERMRAELGSSRPGLFHLKQDKGGMADIEFMVQYLVLRYANQYPDVVEYTDNLRQLQALKAHKILSVKEADGLFDAYRQYRSQAHRLVLMEASASVDNQQFKKERDLVNQLWKRIMEPS